MEFTLFIGQFAARCLRTSDLPWKPSTEADVDVNNTLQPAIAERPAPTIDSTVLPCGARWRRRGAAIETHEHVELPLVDAPEPGGDTSRTPPQLAPRDAELWLLARRTQGAALRLDFDLCTSLVRQVFRRDFVYVSRQLHGLETSRRVQGLDRACLSDALAALQHRTDDVLALLRRIATDLDATLASHAPASARLAFARPARFQATIVSPTAHRYLALLIQADETLARLEMAWLLGLVAAAHRSALLSDCRRALHGFKELACQRRQVVGERVREVNARHRDGVPTGANDGAD
ncbi:hypothetical protein [Scleromatobacter humisilvae]|uniref:DUF1845 domain-containing protein n=1 Tax=Scleromatobacter humisilvae TaxID=2897159 RepID=A0A9X2C059_9BURK|nr:hypothetical protein [Scleromatobacter humisilvae]MCK9684364.1 hypothetical protein [Scleromatobacter humisilvae]